jgi:hypothetical protein
MAGYAAAGPDAQPPLHSMPMVSEYGHAQQQQHSEHAPQPEYKVCSRLCMPSLGS